MLLRFITALICLILVTGCGGDENDAASPQRHTEDVNEPPPAEEEEAAEEEKGLFSAEHRPINFDDGVECGEIDFGSFPEHAAQIHSTELDCEAVRALIAEAHDRKPCQLHGCHQAGFACRSVDGGSMMVTMVCRNETGQIGWIWAGSY